MKLKDLRGILCLLDGAFWRNFITPQSESERERERVRARLSECPPDVVEVDGEMGPSLFT